MNGHFAIHAGQLVQWYFDFEHPFFANVHGQNCMVGQRIGDHRELVQAIGQKRRKLEEPLRQNFVFPKPYVPDFVVEVYEAYYDPCFT
jgi:hypothetical protein